jgi:hypothetical protein
MTILFKDLIIGTSSYFGAASATRSLPVQDAVRVAAGGGAELPDFYNMTLERPKNDPVGFDVLFVDAAFCGSFASRMSHSCTPNCQVTLTF